MEHVSWTHSRDFNNTLWHLYVVYWNLDQKLLYINSSNNDSLHNDLAKHFTDDSARIIKDDMPYRVLGGLKRFMIRNLGLRHHINRDIRFTMYMGSDIGEALSTASKQNKTKSSLFGKGYEEGEPVNIGCSRKGRIWSYSVSENLLEWMKWCDSIGRKVLDETISQNELLRSVMIPEQINDRPPYIPMSVDWPDEIYEKNHDLIQFTDGFSSISLLEIDIVIETFTSDGPLTITVMSSSFRTTYSLQWIDGAMKISVNDGLELFIKIGRSQRSLNEFLSEYPPQITFTEDRYLDNGVLYKYERTENLIFDREKIWVWNWANTNIKVESQTSEKLPSSIQYRVIQTLMSASWQEDYDVIFDDDDKGEVADIVALKTTSTEIILHLFHCKYSSELRSGARVEDLYELLGQCQKSIRWKHEKRKVLYDHLIKRENSYFRQHGVSRFEKGDSRALAQILIRSGTKPLTFNVFAVQPGVSKSKISNSQMEILAATEAYLMDIGAAKFQLIASD